MTGPLMNTILIVDDEYLIADILGFALEDEGYLVEKASNGLKALEALKEKRVELVITDYMMPLLNGDELVRSMRDELHLSDLPVILMSGGQPRVPGTVRRGIRQTLRYGQDDRQGARTAGHLRHSRSSASVRLEAGPLSASRRVFPGPGCQPGYA